MPIAALVKARVVAAALPERPAAKPVVLRKPCAKGPAK
jgi:hypothetical protein